MKSIGSFREYFLLVAVTIGLLLVSMPVLANSIFEPAFNPTLKILKASQSIKIDGIFDDSEWLRAMSVSAFVERMPGDQTKPDVETKVIMTYDNDNLYIGFVCQDNPDDIRATMCQRDRYYSDDAVAVSIDSYRQSALAYMFYVNPYGVQKDGLWTSNNMMGTNMGIDLIWESAAQTTDSGYQVEIAIPFASIRFPDQDVQTWRVDFRRERPRETVFHYGWGGLDRNEQCWPCQWGTVEGIENIHPGKGLEIIPSFISSQRSTLNINSQYIRDDSGTIIGRLPDDVNFRNDDILGEPSLNAKYSISSDITFEATMNPDFSQIEADAAQIDVNSTISLSFPERRPFFQEGSDIFMSLFQSFYTRTVNDPQFATKLTGRMEKTRIAHMFAIDENSPYTIPLEEYDSLYSAGKSYINVLRATQSIGNDTRLGFTVGDRRFKGGGSGSIASVDGDIRLSRNYSIDGQVVLTHTRETDNGRYDSSGITFDKGKHTMAFDGESYYGYASITRFLRRARHWNLHLDFNQCSPSYRTQLGYDPYNNYRNLMTNTSYTFYSEDNIWEQITASMGAYNRWNFDKVHKLRNYYGNIEGRLKFAQTYFGLGFNSNTERFQGRRYEKLWNANFNTNSTFSDKIGYGFGINTGLGIAYDYNVRGNQLGVNFFLDIKPIDRVTIEPAINFFTSNNADILTAYNAIDSVTVDTIDTSPNTKLFEQAIFRTRIQYQVNKQMSIRLVTQFNRYKIYDAVNKLHFKIKRWDIDPLITYRLSSFSVFYFGSSSDYNYLNYLGKTNQPGQTYEQVSKWKLRSRQFFMKLQYLFQM